MPHTALIEAVQRKTAAAVAAVWAEARAEAARCRDDADRAIAQQRAQHERHLQAAAAAARQAANADAARRSRRLRNEALAAAASRAHTVALGALIRFRDAHYPGRLRALIEELPAREWRRIAVNPADVAPARMQFPGCEVVADRAITGGVIAEDAALRVNNTFDRRLAAAWPELLPGVMADVLDAHQRSQPAA